MDLAKLMADAILKQRELLKQRFKDHQLHCEYCNKIIADDEGFKTIKTGLFKYKVSCMDCN